MRSLLGALLAGLVLSLAAVFAVQWSIVRIASDSLLRDYIAGELAQDAEELHGALGFGADGQAAISLAHFDPVFLAPSSGHYYVVLVGDEVALRSLSLVPNTLPVRPVARGGHSVTDMAGPDGQALIVSAKGYDVQGRAVTIAVAADLKPTQAELGRFLTAYTQLSVALFAMLVLLQVVLVRMALSPLARVEADVGRLERGEIRQLGEHVPAEILPLVREVNRLLELLAQRLQRSREAVGNLAHALKAPLTVLNHLATDPEMKEQVEQLRRRVDSELRRARVAGNRVAAEPVALGAEVEGLVGVLRKLHRERDLDIACRVEPGLSFRGDREDLLELCGNLLDNACKWARSRAAIALADGEGIVLTVEDDGPGCTPAEIERLARRGVRLDETTEGHGLGLSIAKSIAESYGATIQFDRSESLGGFRVRVTFPFSA